MTARAAPAAGHRVEVGPDGRPVLAKTARTRSGASRLAGEAATLTALGHPDAVEVVDHRTTDGVASLHVRWVGPHTLATLAAVPLDAAAAALAVVASTVADLHVAGLTHRRLTPDHVLVAADGRPVLTGFADAVSSLRASRTDDIAALGDLIATLAASSGPEMVIPDRRHRSRRDDGLRAALLTLADHARADDPRRRPPAVELAAALGALAAPPTRRRRAA